TNTPIYLFLLSTPLLPNIYLFPQIIIQHNLKRLDRLQVVGERGGAVAGQVRGVDDAVAVGTERVIFQAAVEEQALGVFGALADIARAVVGLEDDHGWVIGVGLGQQIFDQLLGQGGGVLVLAEVVVPVLAVVGIQQVAVRVENEGHMRQQ